MNDITKWQVSNSPSTILNNLKTAILADGGTVDEVLLRNEYLDLHSTIKKQASLVVAGGAYKSGTVYGYNPQTSDLIPFTFTRTGAVSTYVNKEGLIVNAAANIPRFDYDPVTKRFKGLLMEKGSTNMHTYSQDFTNAAWGKDSITVTSTSEVSSIYGTAFKVTEAADTTPKLLYQIINLTSGQTYTAWRVFKAKERSTIRGQIYFGGAIVIADFNLANGTVSGISTGTASIDHLGDGWYKCSITGTATATASHTIRFYTVVGGNPSYEGDGTSSYYTAVAQLEASAYPTSYIPTAGSSVSRGAEECIIGVPGVWYNTVNGTLYGSAMQAFNIPSPSRSVFSISSPGGNRLTIYRQTGTQFANTYAGPSPGSGINGGGTVVGQYWKQAGAYAPGFFTGASFGNIYGNNTATTFDPSLVNGVAIANSFSGGTEYLDGWVKHLAYFPTRLANSELQAITV